MVDCGWGTSWAEPPDALSLVAKSSSHECLVLGWRRWGRGRGRRRGRCIGGVGGGDEEWGSGREGRDSMFNNSHNICRRLEEVVGVGKGWEKGGDGSRGGVGSGHEGFQQL